MTQDSGCRFCGAAAPLLELSVLDEKWSRRFGGDPAVVLSHASSVPEPHDDIHVAGCERRYFRPVVRAACASCSHGWMEEVRWRAEPELVALAEARRSVTALADAPALLRWCVLTAMLTEAIPGMPSISTQTQRHAVRTGQDVVPPPLVRAFSVRQRLPARVHVSQVRVPGLPERGVEVFSVDMAHVVFVMVRASDEQAARAVTRSAVSTALGGSQLGTADDGPAVDHRLDLAASPHPHGVALQRLCAATMPARE